MRPAVLLIICLIPYFLGSFNNQRRISELDIVSFSLRGVISNAIQKNSESKRATLIDHYSLKFRFEINDTNFYTLVACRNLNDLNSSNYSGYFMCLKKMVYVDKIDERMFKIIGNGFNAHPYPESEGENNFDDTRFTYQVIDSLNSIIMVESL